jgi:hypothetical protein
VNTEIDLITGAKIVAQRAPDREEEFLKEFGFQSSEMDFVNGYAAACLHLIAIGNEEVIPFVTKNPALYKKGLEHYTYAALLAEEFNGGAMTRLPPVSKFPQFVAENFSKPKTNVQRILHPIINLIW